MDGCEECVTNLYFLINKETIRVLVSLNIYICDNQSPLCLWSVWDPTWLCIVAAGLLFLLPWPPKDGLCLLDSPLKHFKLWQELHPQIFPSEISWLWRVGIVEFFAMLWMHPINSLGELWGRGRREDTAVLWAFILASYWWMSMDGLIVDINEYLVMLLCLGLHNSCRLFMSLGLVWVEWQTQWEHIVKKQPIFWQAPWENRVVCCSAYQSVNPASEYWRVDCNWISFAYI